MKHHPVCLWVLLTALLMACTPSEPPTKTVIVTPTVQPSPTITQTPFPSPTPAPRELTICMGAEPASLYLYDDTSYAARLIREAIYDGPIDTVGYAHHPVILEKLPSLADGDAVITTVTVETGTKVIDDGGEVVSLAKGTRLRPSGCRADNCAVAFDGTPVTMDQIQATFVLKPGLRWSDGEFLTARDSVYSFELARHPDTPAWKWLELRTGSYVAADDRTLVWTGLPGFLDPAYTTAFWTPLPAHAWQNYREAAMLDRPDVIRTPLSYGPYVIDKWEPGQFMRLSRNPYYFRKDEGLPTFDTLTFRFMMQNTTPALTALESGSCDILTLEFYLENELERLQAMDVAGTIHAYSIPSTRWEHLTFNVVPPPDYAMPPFFQDVRTRRAIAACINRQRLVDDIAHGIDGILDVYLPPEHPLYAAASLSRHPYDPAQGQALLDDVGWRDTDGDGMREAHSIAGLFDGTPFHIRYTTSNAAVRQMISAAIAEDLAACGILVDVETLNVQALFAEGAGTPVYGRQFDLVEFAWLTDVIPPCALYLSTEISSVENQWNGQNFGGYANPAYDAACLQALSALPGEPEHIAAHAEAQKLFSEALPALPLFRYTWYLAARPDLDGFIPDAIAVETWNIEAFTLVP